MKTIYLALVLSALSACSDGNPNSGSVNSTADEFIPKDDIDIKDKKY